MICSPPKSHDCIVLSNKRLSENNIYLTRLHCPNIAQNSSSGQFVNIKVSNELSPLLRRPFSICKVDKAEGWFEVLWQIVGRGTTLMAGYKVDDVINIIGPLGHGFHIKSGIESAILVGGGLGIAPLPFLCQDILEKFSANIAVYVGVRTKADLAMAELFNDFDINIIQCTEDGSAGIQGYVTKPLIEKLASKSSVPPVLFSCGPEVFLKRMVDISAEFEVEGQISVESVMGCGFGICVGCPVEVQDYAEGERKYKLTCIDGPVFDSREVLLVG